MHDVSETWEHEYRRMRRQHDRLKQTADQNKLEDIHDMNRALDIYHFCCDAFHLRDWSMSIPVPHRYALHQPPQATNSAAGF